MPKPMSMSAHTRPWTQKRLDSLIEFKNGLNFDADQRGSGVKIIGVGDFKDAFSIDYEHLERVNIPPDLDESYFLKDGDLLFVRSNGNKALIGRVLLIHRVHERIIHSGFTIRARATTADLSPAFVAAFFSSSVVKRQLHRLGGGTNISNLSQDLLAQIVVPVPPPSEQAVICEVLATAREAEHRIVQLYRARCRFKRWLLQQMLTGQRRFAKFSEQPWRECCLRDVADECSEQGRGTLSRQLVMGVTKGRGIVPMDDRLIGDVDRYQIVRRDWFAYNPMRLNIGSLARLRQDKPVLVSPDYVVFRCRDGELDPSFLDQYRRGHQWESFMRVCGAGSVRLRIYFKELGRLRLSLPPMEEQRRIAEALDTLDTELDQLRRLHDALKAQKTGLMQRLLTGRLRVPASMLREVAHA